MSSMNEKYKAVLTKISESESENLSASQFNITYSELSSIIEELERDSLINKTIALLNKSFVSMGLTFTGRSFLENNDSKEYHKIEKTEINNSVNIETNHGIAVAGNDNTINTSEFSQKFTQLIQEIENSSIGNKVQILQELHEKKDDSVALQSYLGNILTRGAEVATVVPAIGTLLGMLG